MNHNSNITYIEVDDSLSASSSPVSSDEPSGGTHVESVDEPVPSSGSVSPVSEQQSNERLESSSSQNMENYTNIRLVRQNSPSYAPSEPHQQQPTPSELPSFSVSILFFFFFLIVYYFVLINVVLFVYSRRMILKLDMIYRISDQLLMNQSGVRCFKSLKR